MRLHADGCQFGVPGNASIMYELNLGLGFSIIRVLDYGIANVIIRSNLAPFYEVLA